MKRFLTTMVLIAMVLSANAQCHCHQQQMRYSCNQNIYDEVIKLVRVIESTSCIECMEGIKLNNDVMETYGGEIILKKERNLILITHKELKTMIEYRLMNPHRRFVNDINSIRTELYMYNVELLKYINKKLYYNRNIKNIYIVTDQIPGASYVCIEYYHL
jgi:hypothetical protein